MASALAWVLVGIVAYTLVAMALKARDLLPSYVSVSGPLLTISTDRGKEFVDRLSRPRRLWRAYTNIGLGLAFVVMAGSFLLFVTAGIASLLAPPEPTAVTNPRNALVIPGVNQFLPLEVTPYLLIGLAIALIIHEGGHALLCRVGDIDISKMGLFLFTLLPLGAFVEPDEESRAEANRGAQTRMFVAGVTNNFLISVVAFALLLGPVSGAIAVVDGVPVHGTHTDGPADRAGIGAGDVLVEADGVALSDRDDLAEVLTNTSARTLDVELRSGETVTVERRLIVRSAPRNFPIDVNSTVRSVNGTEIYTRLGFLEAIQDRQVATLRTDEGNVTLPMGALVSVDADGPLARAGLAENSTVVTSVAGERIRHLGDLADALDTHTAGDTVMVTAGADEGLENYTVTLGESGDATGAELGVETAYGGTTGMLFWDFGVTEYPADRFLAVLGGDGGPDYGNPALGPQLANLFMMPFLGAVPGGGVVGFAGFVGFASNFFVVQGPLAALGPGIVFALANVLFWVGWINLIVGHFNLIPAYPLDGGHILRTSTEAIVARLPVARKRLLTKAVTVTIGLSMLLSILAAYLAPRLLG